MCGSTAGRQYPAARGFAPRGVGGHRGRLIHHRERRTLLRRVLRRDLAAHPPSRARPAQSAGVRSGTNRILGHLQDTGSPTADTAPLQTGRNQSAPRTSSSTGTGSPETVSEQATPPNRSNPPLRRETCPHSAPRIAVLPSRNPALAVLPESKAPNRVCYRRTRTRRRGASSLRPQDLRHLRRPAVRRRVRSPTDVPERNPALPNPCREPA